VIFGGDAAQGDDDEHAADDDATRIFGDRKKK